MAASRSRASGCITAFSRVDSAKMSKSLGNFVTVHDLLEHGVPGEAIRLALLSTHYRDPLDWTDEKLEQAKATLDRWYRALSLRRRHRRRAEHASPSVVAGARRRSEHAAGDRPAA